MISPWHEQYESVYARNDPPWTLQGSFVGLVRAAYRRHGLSATTAELGEVWHHMQRIHDEKRPTFPNCARLCAYIQRTASRCAINELRSRQATANRCLPVVEEPVQSESLTDATALAVCERIGVTLGDIDLPQAVEVLRTKLRAFGPIPYGLDPASDSNAVVPELTAEQIDLRVKLLHWYGAGDTLLAYFLHLHGCPGTKISMLLGLSTPTVSRRLKQARELFGRAARAIIEPVEGVLE